MSVSAEKSTEMLQLGLVLRQNATQCLAHACQTPDGTWSDAALAASVSIALIDVGISSCVRLLCAHHKLSFHRYSLVDMDISQIFC